MPDLLAISPQQREQHLQWLKELTQIPTAAGREQRVMAWIERWAASRRGLSLTHDSAKNMIIRQSGMSLGGGALGRPVFFQQPLPFPDTRPANDQGDVDVIFRVTEKHTGN